jgi:hypothetical protein
LKLEEYIKQVESSSVHDNKHGNKFIKYVENVEKTENHFGFSRRLKTNSRGCVFLNENNLCKIHLKMGYEFKPTMCRLFPFSFMVKWNGDLLLIIKHYCNGIKQGKCSDETIKHAIECCKELYVDELDNIRIVGMENSVKTKLDDRNYITWEEREELGKYIFNNNESLEELAEKCREILKMDVYKDINYIHNNLNNINLNMCGKTYNNEMEIMRYMGELNKREHFRKLSFKDEVIRLINIGKELSEYEDVLRAEGVVDSKLLL